MKILGIDQSYTSAGYCVINEKEEVLTFGLVKTVPDDGDSFTRARTITNELKKIADEYSVDFVGLEGLAFGGFGNATRDLAGLQFLIVDAFGSNKVTITAPTAVKKLALGKRTGKIVKNDLFEALPELTQKSFLDFGLKKTKGLFDVTDSYWISLATLRVKTNEKSDEKSNCKNDNSKEISS